MAKATSILGFVEALGRKLADKYPDTAPPVTKVDPKKGPYQAKGETPETKAIMDARKTISKDIELGNYDPFFPVEQRFYADSSQYDLVGNTLTDTLPKTQKTIDAKIAQFDTPEARASLRQAFEKAADDPMAADWYALGQLEKLFIDELGPEAGRKAFKDMFADAMAATTGGADPGSNLLMAQYGNFLRQQGMEVPDAAYKMPVPIGGRFVTGNMQMFDRVANKGQALTAADQPKRFNFSSNFLGDRNRATIDEQMTAGMTGGQFNAPPQGSYGILEGIVHDEAAKLGIKPANMQDVSWAGYKNIQGKPMIQFVNEAIERTARLTGQTPEQVARGIPRGKPLYDAGGAAIGAGTILGALGLSDRSEASVVPAGLTQPSMADVRSAMEQSGSGSQDAQQFILDALLGFAAPQSLGDATMTGRARNATR